jgi:2-oxoisovalerate dehydrogenase E1 component alpha subunit
MSPAVLTGILDREPHQLLALYHAMVMARAIERRLWVVERLEPSRVLPEPRAMRWGGEAVQVAAATALRGGHDWVLPEGGDIALCLAMGLSPLDVMLAVYGRASDPGSGGRDGALGSRSARVVTTSGDPARRMLHAAGIAYAAKARSLDECVLACIDEARTASGDWHEAINFAAVHSLALICLVQGRRRGTSALPAHQAVSPTSSAGGYGVAGAMIDGGDFEAALAAFSRAVERARSGGGPTLIHAPVIELTSLSPAGGLRPAEELEAMAQEDAIDRMRRFLIGATVLDDAGDEQVRRDCASVVETAVREADEAASPEPAAALDNVFWEEPAHG